MAQHAVEVEREGLAIRGMAYRPDRPGRHPAVLMLHGFAGQRMESAYLFVQLGRALAQRGVAAVAFDYLHCGESDGSVERMLVSGHVADALRMSAWLGGQPFVDRSRLGLLGISLGGLVGACVVGQLNQYQALAMLAPTTVQNLCRHAGETPEGAAVTVGPHVLHREFFRDARTLNPVAEVARNPRPTLLVQGDADKAVPPAVSQAYVDAMQRANVPVQAEIIGGGDHTFTSPGTRQRVVQLTADWLRDRLAL